MTERRVVHQAPSADIQRVMRAREERTGPAMPVSERTEGGHVWAASGLRGFVGGAPTSVFAQSGLRDAFADLRASTPDPRDWVTTVAGAMTKGR